MIFSCENKDDATLAFMQRTSIEVRPPIAKVTMPLFNLADSCLWSTGVLLKVREKHFILTAAHVFDKWQTRPIPINITDGVVGHQLFPIGEVTLRPGDSVLQPPMVRHREVAHSDDLELLEVTSPAEFVTRLAEQPAAPA